jgi:hypothetical protein
MMNEYENIWQYLNKKGCLLSHDILLNDAFLDFSDKVNLKQMVYEGIGGLQKV